MTDYDECTCDFGSPVGIGCPWCDAREAREERKRSLELLADLVEAFNIVMVQQLREAQAAVWRPR